MIELRWRASQRRTGGGPQDFEVDKVLQYRVFGTVYKTIAASSEYSAMRPQQEWSEWHDVPTVWAT